MEFNKPRRVEKYDIDRSDVLSVNNVRGCDDCIPLYSVKVKDLQTGFN